MRTLSKIFFPSPSWMFPEKKALSPRTLPNLANLLPTKGCRTGFVNQQHVEVSCEPVCRDPGSWARWDSQMEGDLAVHSNATSELNKPNSPRESVSSSHFWGRNQMTRSLRLEFVFNQGIISNLKWSCFEACEPKLDKDSHKPLHTGNLQGSPFIYLLWLSLR